MCSLLSDDSASFTDEETQKARSELLETRAQYVLRNDVVEAVVAANPILKAVHSDAETATIERYVVHSGEIDPYITFASELLPYIERRDDASISVATQASQTNKVWKALTTAQSDTLKKSRQNVTLAAELFELADQAKLKKRVPPNNSRMMEEQEKLEAEVRASKQRWRVVKGVAGGIIVGSGVDWVRDDELRDAVLDPETEE